MTNWTVTCQTGAKTWTVVPDIQAKNHVHAMKQAERLLTSNGYPYAVAKKAE